MVYPHTQSVPFRKHMVMIMISHQSVWHAVVLYIVQVNGNDTANFITLYNFNDQIRCKGC